MKRSDLTEKILDIKREQCWSWSHTSRAAPLGAIGRLVDSAAPPISPGQVSR
jgi:hypothetical protein